MFDPRYENQVRLILLCLPQIARRDCFALKGGTALNLFVQDLPRVSIDIDLTYLPLKPRDEARSEIATTLLAIKRDVEAHVPGCTVDARTIQGRTAKLDVKREDAAIRIEPNLVLRGTVHAPQTRDLVPAAEKHFQRSVQMLTVSEPDLYGGKLCAALDRQHPRDLFDLKLLLDGSGIIPAIRRAFVVYLAGHSRPMNELLAPKPQDIAALYDEQFTGMTRSAVSLQELTAVRDQLGPLVRNALDEKEKRFLVSMKQGEPDWDLLGIDHLRELPALQWKLINVRKMSASKHASALNRLREVLNM